MHTHTGSTLHIALPTIAYHQRISYSSTGLLQCVMKQCGSRLQDTNIIRKDNIVEIDIQTGRTHLMALQFVEAIGKNKKLIACRKFLQHFMCMGDNFALSGNYLKEIVGKVFSYCLSLRNANYLQGINKSLAVQFIFCHLSGSIIYPKLVITLLIELIKMFEGWEESSVTMFLIHLKKSTLSIHRECPECIIEVEE